MPYALIPEGFELKKVTKAQEQAVNAKRRHDDVQAFIEMKTRPSCGGLITAFFGVKLAEDIIADIESRLGALSDDVKEGIRETVNIKIQAPVITTPSGTPFRPPSIKLKDIIEAILP